VKKIEDYRVGIGDLVHFTYLSDTIIHGIIKGSKFFETTEKYEYLIEVQGDLRWIGEDNIWL
jgi:hypothetical protein